jgi:hypothetical protein
MYESSCPSRRIRRTPLVSGETLPELVSSPLNAGKIAYADVNVNMPLTSFAVKIPGKMPLAARSVSPRRNKRPFCVVSDWLKLPPEFSVKIEAKASVSGWSDV